jgi:hypothetical protein
LHLAHDPYRAQPVLAAAERASTPMRAPFITTVFARLSVVWD